MIFFCKVQNTAVIISLRNYTFQNIERLSLVSYKVANGDVWLETLEFQIKAVVYSQFDD